MGGASEGFEIRMPTKFPLLRPNSFRNITSGPNDKNRQNNSTPWLGCNITYLQNSVRKAILGNHIFSTFSRLDRCLRLSFPPVYLV